jgi:hypothetical protein
VGATLFGESIKTLLHSSYRLDHVFHATKYAALTRPEHFAIKCQGWYAPNELLRIAEVQMANVPVDSEALDAMRLFLLSQIVSEIS